MTLGRRLPVALTLNVPISPVKRGLACWADRWR